MPEWAGWVLFVMILYAMNSQKDYAGVISNLLNKVEELESRIEELESKVDDLEGEVEELEDKE